MEEVEEERMTEEKDERGGEEGEVGGEVMAVKTGAEMERAARSKFMGRGEGREDLDDFW